MLKLTPIWWLIIVSFIIVILTGGLLFVSRRQSIKNSPSPSPRVSASPTVSTEVSTQIFRAKDVPENTIFDFEATIPTHWRSEYIPSIEALNIYDPTIEGNTNVEKSVIFLRHFSGSSFLTLSTVTIHERDETTVAKRPAVRYVIEKKPSIANFANQPTWRNIRHTVTDVRLIDTNPSQFYVLAERPGNSVAYQQFLNSLTF